MINFDHFPYNRSFLPKDDQEKRELFKQLELQFCEEIKNAESAKAYFSNYNPDSIEHFIAIYASRKAHLCQCYDLYSETYHEKVLSELHFQNEAEDVLKMILQKKMFNMQLQWRAGQLEIKEVNFSYDFQFWEKRISDCPFISPIERDELELMKEYLMRFDMDDEVDDIYLNWQDYDSLTAKNENGLMDDLPEWYQFYDLHTGTGSLLLLPDLKGEKEDFYLSLCNQDSTKNEPPRTYTPSAPWLNAFGEEIFNFSQFFETDKYFKALFKYYNYYNEKESRHPNMDDLREAMELLFTADRPVHCHNHLTWDNAIMVAAKEYRNTKIAEALDFVYDEYRMMKELGFAKDKSRQEIMEEYNKDIIARYYRKNILMGRKLNGEPEDFDY